MQLGESAGQLLWPAVDVGGTTIRVVLVADRGDEPPEPVVRIEIPSVRGLAELIGVIRSSMAEAEAAAGSRGFRVARAIGIGTPGRLEEGRAGRRVIAPRTAVNLESFPGEMDGVDLAGALAEALGLPEDRVFWDNDAVVQGRHLIGELLRVPESADKVEGHAVVCINPGTGVGGCVAEVLADGAVEVFTDSHVSELLLHPVELARDLGPLRTAVRSSADASVVEVEIRVGGEESLERMQSPVGKQAEDFLSGTGLAMIAAGLERCADRVLPSRTLFGAIDSAIDGAMLSTLIADGGDTTVTRAARFVGDLGGVALARLLEVLHDGAAVKSARFPDWSRAELDRLRGVSVFVLGGGITKTPLGQRMIAGARSRHPEWTDLRIFEMDEVADDAGVLGAFSLIPADLRRSSRG